MTTIGTPGQFTANGLFPVVDGNEVANALITGYANLAALALVPSYLVTRVGMLANTLDGNTYKVTSLVGPTWTAVTSTPTGAAGGDLGGTYPNPTVASVTGTAGTLTAAAALVLFQFAAAATAPKLGQATGTTDANGQPLRLGAQAPWASSTDRAPGNVELDVPAPTGSGAQGYTVFRFAGGRRASMGYDGTRAFLEMGASSAATASSGQVRYGTSVIGSAFLGGTGVTVGAIEHAYTASEDYLYINRSSSGVNSANNLYLDSSTLIALLRNGGPAAYFYSGGFLLFSGITMPGTANRAIAVTQALGNTPAKTLTLSGSGASASGTGANLDSAGVIIVGAGAQPLGREKSLLIYKGLAPGGAPEDLLGEFVEVVENQPLVALCGTAPITPTIAPATGGTMGLWLGPASAMPLVPPGTIGWTSVHGDAAGDGCWAVSHAGGVVELGTTANVLAARTAIGASDAFSVGAATGTVFRGLAIADTGYELVVATAAGAHTIDDQASRLILDPAAPIASFTVTTPPAPVDGQVVSISTTFAITTLTITANAGQTLAGAGIPVTLAAGAAVRLIYIGTTWFPTT